MSHCKAKGEDPVERALFAFEEAWFSGTHPDPETFCLNHPECGPELCAAIQDFLFVADRLPKKGRNHASEAGKRIGDFRILEEMGRGGMGVVYEAEQITMHRKVALKVLPPHLSMSRQAIQRFRREAEAGGRQAHPSIVSIYAVGEHEGIHFIAQEFVEGGATLADRLERSRKTGSIPRGYFRETAMLVAKVADALHFAHATGVIHRDVKPSNILLARDGTPKVSDFGLARVEDALALSRSGDFAGTPYYMSPEQVSSRRSHIDFRTDIYSLGVTLYEMLTLSRPFEAETTQEVLKKVIFDEPREPHKLSRRVPIDLSVICLKAMEKRPDQRYETMRAFMDDLNRYLSGDVILASPAGAGTRIWRRVKRNPALSTAVGVAMATVFILFMYVFWSYPVILDERNNAIRARDAKERQLKVSEGLRLANQSTIMLPQNPGLALLLGIESSKRNPGLLANNAVLQALKMCREIKALYHDDNVLDAIFTRDGRCILTVLEGKAAFLWDAGSFEPLAAFEGHGADLLTASFSPDNTKLITGSKDFTALVWDLHTCKSLVRLCGHTDRVKAVSFSPDSGRALTASADGSARIWDVNTGTTFFHLTGHTEPLSDACFSPDGKTVVTASNDHTARIWDGDTGQTLFVLRGHSARTGSVRFSADGQHVITASDDCTARIWDTSTGKTIFVLRGHENEVLAACFSPDSTRAVTGSFDSTARIWDTATGETVARLVGHENDVRAVCFSPDSRRVATSSWDETARIWDATTGVEIMTLHGHEMSVESVCFSPDGMKILTGSRDATARLWDLESNRRIITLAGHGNIVLAAEFNPDGNRIATASMDETARIWDAQTGREIAAFKGHTHWVGTARFSPDGERLLTASWDGTAKVWDLGTGEPFLHLEKHDGFIRTACFSPDGTKVLTGGDDQKVRVWDAFTGALLLLLEEPEIKGLVNCVCFSPDSQRIAVAVRDPVVNIWQVETGERTAGLWGHERLVRCARFSPDNEKLLTGSDDKTARLWEVATGRELAILRGHEGSVLFADFSPDGSKVIT
ncbi:MAG: protein kinase, partial [Planctomycetota bacterium]